MSSKPMAFSILPQGQRVEFRDTRDKSSWYKPGLYVEQMPLNGCEPCKKGAVAKSMRAPFWEHVFAIAVIVGLFLATGLSGWIPGRYFSLYEKDGSVKFFGTYAIDSVGDFMIGLTIVSVHAGILTYISNVYRMWYANVVAAKNVEIHQNEPVRITIVLNNFYYYGSLAFTLFFALTTIWFLLAQCVVSIFTSLWVTHRYYCIQSRRTSAVAR